MGYDSIGYGVCEYCGAEFRLFTIFKRDMQGLARGWKRRHERARAKRSAAQRLVWARPYVAKDRFDSSIVVDTSHVGFSK